jgi:RNA polymerase sigma-70 factor (ECF subfamily)
VADPTRFQQVVLPHLNSAYNLARWLLRNDHDAEDAVQDACVRALKYIDNYRGENPRAWLLAIVRNACFDRMRSAGGSAALDDDALEVADAAPDPEVRLIQARDAALLNRLIEALPPDFRAVVVLRELEELSYQEIAQVMGIPVGTVMSRLSRARGLLQKSWRRQTEGVHGL